MSITLEDDTTVAAFLPPRDVATGAARIASGDFSIRIPQEGPAEIRELTGAFNSMATSVETGRRNLQRQNEQLRQSEQAKSELITIVAHELRTPLATIDAYLEGLADGVVDGASDQRALRLALEAKQTGVPAAHHEP